MKRQVLYYNQNFLVSKIKCVTGKKHAFVDFVRCIKQVKSGCALSSFWTIIQRFFEPESVYWSGLSHPSENTPFQQYRYHTRHRTRLPTITVPMISDCLWKNFGTTEMSLQSACDRPVLRHRFTLYNDTLFFTIWV